MMAPEDRKEMWGRIRFMLIVTAVITLVADDYQARYQQKYPPQDETLSVCWPTKDGDLAVITRVGDNTECSLLRRSKSGRRVVVERKELSYAPKSN